MFYGMEGDCFGEYGRFAKFYMYLMERVLVDDFFIFKVVE